MRKKMFFCLILLLGLVLIICTKVDANSDIPGDINLDGSITSKDSALLSRYLRGRENLSEQALKNADVYKDGNIDMADVDIIVKYLQNITVIDKLPYIRLIGDVNFDGKRDNDDLALIDKHIKYNGYFQGCRVLNDAQKLNADISCDGIVDKKDRDELYYFILSENRVYGDLNFDGKFTILDVNMLKDYLYKNKNLNDGQKLNADLYCDNKIDEKDLYIMYLYFYKLLPREKIPYRPQPFFSNQE